MVVKTLAADHKSDLRLSFNEDVAFEASFPLFVDNVLLFSLVLGLILLGLGEIELLLILEMLLMLLLLLSSFSSDTCLTFLQFQDVLWDGLSSDMRKRD